MATQRTSPAPPSNKRTLESRRAWLYRELEATRGLSAVGRAVRWVVSTLIILNVIALVTVSHLPQTHPARFWFWLFEAFSVGVFTAEYLARIWVAPEGRPRWPAWRARLRYARTPLAIIDVLAILPFYLPMLGVDLRALRVMRLMRLMRVLKLGRYSRSMRLLWRVLRRAAPDLGATFFVISLLLVVASSLVYHAETRVQPEKFPNITAAMWWGVAALTTVGYGDIVPITAAGRILGSMVAILGIGLFGLPAGIIANTYMQELRRRRDGERCPHCHELLSHEPGASRRHPEDESDEDESDEDEDELDEDELGADDSDEDESDEDDSDEESEQGDGRPEWVS